MVLNQITARTRQLARVLISAHGRSAEAVALATVATLMESGQLDYAELWQQVARAVSTILTGANSI